MAQDGGGRSKPRPGRFTPWKRNRYPLYGRLGGPQGQSGWVQKITPSPGLDPRIIQPIASCCTDSAILAHTHTFKIDYSVNWGSYLCQFSRDRPGFLRLVPIKTTGKITVLQDKPYLFHFTLDSNAGLELDIYSLAHHLCKM